MGTLFLLFGEHYGLRKDDEEEKKEKDGW